MIKKLSSLPTFFTRDIPSYMGTANSQIVALLKTAKKLPPKTLFVSLGLLITIIGAVVGLVLMSQSQDVRQQASGGFVYPSLSPKLSVAPRFSPQPSLSPVMPSQSPAVGSRSCGTTGHKAYQCLDDKTLGRCNDGTVVPVGPCTSGQTCVNGVCVASAAPSAALTPRIDDPQNRCDREGQVYCGVQGGFPTSYRCVQGYGQVIRQCAAGQTCEWGTGNCVTPTQNASCGAVPHGAPLCIDGKVFGTCNNGNRIAVGACTSEQTCVNGACVASAAPPTTPAPRLPDPSASPTLGNRSCGTTGHKAYQCLDDKTLGRCNDGTVVPVGPCTSGQTCVNGVCVASAAPSAALTPRIDDPQNRCDREGQVYCGVQGGFPTSYRCVQGYGQVIRQCAAGQTCEWGTGNCVTPTQNASCGAVPHGAPLCIDGKVFGTCNNGNRIAVGACTSEQTCVNGACVASAAPPTTPAPRPSLQPAPSPVVHRQPTEPTCGFLYTLEGGSCVPRFAILRFFMR